MKPDVNLDCIKLCRNGLHFIYFFEVPKIPRSVSYAATSKNVKLVSICNFCW